MSVAINLFTHFVVAFIAIIAFAILFHTPREYYISCGLTGAAGWLCYNVFLLFNSSVVVASLGAAVLLTLLSRIYAVIRSCPITVFLICGIFPLVPGAGIYYSAYYFIMGQTNLFGEKAIETFKIAVAIALGIVFVLAIPNTAFKKLPKKREPS